MRKALYMGIILAMFVSCQTKEEKDKEYIDNILEQRKNDTVTNQIEAVINNNKILDSLNKVYTKKGFASFCTIKADLDSVFLTANYMAEILLNGDVSSENYTTLTSRIEKDRAIAYYKKNNLNRKQVINDLMLIAMEYPLPCEDYVNSRYNMVKEYIRTKHKMQLYREAYRKYK